MLSWECSTRDLRSPVPDLLYESEQIRRLTEIQDLIHEPAQLSSASPMHRLTVFLTYRCNLACPYCKTISRSPEDSLRFPQKTGSFDLPAFKRLLASHNETQIQHMHLTGGEATLIPHLPEMIQHAKSQGVEYVSMTSNGVRSPEYYRELIESGLDELRISFDAANPETGNALTLHPRAWARTIKTLENLRELKDQGLAFYLIINTVVTKLNRNQLPQLLELIETRCSPDDIKLITEVDSVGDLDDFAEYPRVIADLQAFLHRAPPNHFPLLRRKIQTAFAPDAIGLKEIESPGDRIWRCYIPLTERTVDSTNYYPCSVYLREGGAPLGLLSDDAEIQRQKTVKFVTEENCLEDSICRQYCLHCTRSYNQKANELYA